MKYIFAALTGLLLAGCGSGFSAAKTGGVAQDGSSSARPPSPAPTALPTPNPNPAPTPGPSPGGDANGVTAVAADYFLSSLGINTHIDQGVSGSSCVSPLKYLGVRAIRDGERNVSELLVVHQQAGVKADITSYGNLSAILTTARTLSDAGALLSLEGPNEPNNFPITYNGQAGGGSGSWAAVAQYQKDLYSAVKSDAKLNGYPVFAVSEAGAEVDNVGLQFLTIPSGAGTTFPAGTKFADFANPHNYVSGTQNHYLDNQAWTAADPLVDGGWDGLYVEYGKTWNKQFAGYSNADLQTLPRVTTETGWDSVGDAGGERTQGTVLVNTYLAQFKRGWRYTFIYMLRDGEGGNGNQGVFNADSSPKLAATYIHNLTTLLADSTPIASPGKLDYSITNPPSTVHDLLIQKSNGVFDLIVWGEKVSGSSSVTVTFARSHASVKVYDVTSGTTATSTLSAVNSVTLDVSDHALVLEINN